MGWYDNDNASDKAMQKRADEQRASEAADALEYEAAWAQAKAVAKAEAVKKRAAWEIAHAPIPTQEENIAAMRRLLEADHAKEQK